MTYANLRDVYKLSYDDTHAAMFDKLRTHAPRNCDLLPQQTSELTDSAEDAPLLKYTNSARSYRGHFLLWLNTAALVLLVVTFMFGYFLFYTLQDVRESYTSGATIDGFIEFPYLESPIRIVLLGDSLINVPFLQFDLGGKLAENLPPYTYRIYNQAGNGRTIARIKDELLEDALERRPHAMIMFWDTDCSGIDESVMTDEEVTEIRAAYVSNLRYVINATLAAGTQYMAVSAPGLLGEGGWMGDFHVPWKNRQGMLDDYRDITKSVCESMGVDYIDMRHALRAAKPFFWPLNVWSVTIDGEHPSNLGARVEAQQFADALKGWLEAF